MTESEQATATAVEWLDALSVYRMAEARISKSNEKHDERPGRDSLGNPGTVETIELRGEYTVALPRERVLEHLSAAGLDVTRETREQCELRRGRADTSLVDEDPFLQEDVVIALVTGRDFPGAQRSVLEKKVALLRAELDDPDTDAARRAEASQRLEAIENGLLTRVRVRETRRRFHPQVNVGHARETFGSTLPLGPGARLTYRVDSSLFEDLDDEENGAMMFHVVAVGEAEIVLLYTGGVHGFRHVLDMAESVTFDAWFSNRERARTVATAPWLGRRVYRELVEEGASEVTIHHRRDPEPIAIEKVATTTHTVVVDGEEREVPVIECRTSRDDELIVLADPESPLVLRMVESGVSLVRRVEAIFTDRMVAAPTTPAVA